MTGLSAELVAGASTTYDDVRMVPGGVAWIEGRADGRDVLVRWTAGHGKRDLIPQGVSVASRVHEYGGGAWAVIAVDGGMIRALRDAHGFSQPLLARLAGLNPATVARLEGEGAPYCHRRTLDQISAMLGVPSASLELKRTQPNLRATTTQLDADR